MRELKALWTKTTKTTKTFNLSIKTLTHSSVK